MADTGLPLLATAGGLGLAYFLFRGQLASDRRLRRADHKLDAATKLGLELKQAASELSRMDPADDWWWQSHWWTRSKQLHDAISDASLFLPSGSSKELSEAVDSASDAWQACYIGAVQRKPDVRFHGMATRKVLEPFAVLLAQAAETLRKWDGADRLPSSLLGTFDKAPPRTDRESWKVWMESKKATYLDRVDSFEGKKAVDGKWQVSLDKAAGRRVFEQPFPDASAAS
jgi:hypothetical protein